MITRNHCLSYAQAGIVVGTLAIVPGFIGLMFLSQGLWMIMPFAGLEILAVSAGFYASVRHNGDVESVDIDENAVRIYRRVAQREQYICLRTCWTRVLLEASESWYPSRLWVKSAGQQVELGRWLTERERGQLAARLKDLIKD